jgi:hypothetical protein
LSSLEEHKEYGFVEEKNLPIDRLVYIRIIKTRAFTSES